MNRVTINFRKGYFIFLLILIAACSLLGSCNRKEKSIPVDPAFSKYIDGYTSGVISKTGAIRVRLTEETPATHSINEPLKEKLFSFTPQVKGKAYWIDARTIEFKPDENLRPINCIM